ncbi:hypothetical protein CPC08DRAFT_729281 [Agrocybe pediades]|nr:hypothetical protein CPC08DRAFT_729281 [Agrocybe pediades]
MIKPLFSRKGSLHHSRYISHQDNMEEASTGRHSLSQAAGPLSLKCLQNINTIRHNLTYNEVSRKLQPNVNSKRRSIGDAWVINIRLHGTKSRKKRSKAKMGSSGVLESNGSQFPAVEHNVPPSESISPSMVSEDTPLMSPTFHPLAVITLDGGPNSHANLQSPWKTL